MKLINQYTFYLKMNASAENKDRLKLIKKMTLPAARMIKSDMEIPLKNALTQTGRSSDFRSVLSISKRVKLRSIFHTNILYDNKIVPLTINSIIVGINQNGKCSKFLPPLDAQHAHRNKQRVLFF
jgi:hypothetical protein